MTRNLGVLGLFADALFFGIAFLWSFGPGDGLLLKVVYGALGCGSLLGAVALLWAKGKDQD